MCTFRHKEEISNTGKMKIAIGTSVVVLLLTQWNVDLTVAGWDKPIPATEYQKIIGQGFAVSLFRGYFDEIYNISLIKAVKDSGLTNLRIRCHADDEAEVTSTNFSKFLSNLTTVVDDCLSYNITPIISWTHKRYVGNVTIEGAKRDYITWWKKVAIKLRGKDYRCSFNLLTEIADGECKKMYNDCRNGLMNNTDIYNQWTKAAVAKIRETGGKNIKRILILASPLRAGEGLPLIDESIYKNDTYMMVEFHKYAAGPNKQVRKNGKMSDMHWSGNGSETDRNNVLSELKFGTDFTASTGIPTYFGAWMPADNKNGGLNQSEVINFARFIIRSLGKAKIPWTLNALLVYFDKKTYTWIEEQDVQGAKLNMSAILEQVKDAMKPYTPYATK